MEATLHLISQPGKQKTHFAIISSDSRALYATMCRWKSNLFPTTILTKRYISQPSEIFWSECKRIFPGFLSECHYVCGVLSVRISPLWRRDYKWGHRHQSRPISKLLVYTVNVAFPHISSKLKKNIPVCGDKISAALRSIGLHRSWAKHRHHFNQKLGGMLF